ncbi:hypothetical protein HPB47_005269 [Ixodes persulcatus]|uniref:Uncharacterized protein n=1 Tax=Ixodes persulcatus TaxID=34615 RepID=A0AC60PDE5_IXOPE|nr:hypothetical protein HPB47_005269 [Ixodes persulcatus]
MARALTMAAGGARALSLGSRTSSAAAHPVLRSRERLKNRSVADQHSPAFISQPGTTILSATHLLDFVPRGVTRLILHLGTNDLATTGYRNLLGLIRERRPDISHVYVTLVLPHSPNRRRGSSNRGFVARFNGRARALNGRLRGLCHRERNTYFLDHCLDQLPRRLAMAADGLHLSFCSVSYLAWNVHRLLARCHRRTTDVWRDHAASLEPVVDTLSRTRLRLCPSRERRCDAWHPNTLQPPEDIQCRPLLN